MSKPKAWFSSSFTYPSEWYQPSIHWRWANKTLKLSYQRKPGSFSSHEKNQRTKEENQSTSERNSRVLLGQNNQGLARTTHKVCSHQEIGNTQTSVMGKNLPQTEHFWFSLKYVRVLISSCLQIQVYLILLCFSTHQILCFCKLKVCGNHAVAVYQSHFSDSICSLCFPGLYLGHSHNTSTFSYYYYICYGDMCLVILMAL